MKKLFPAIAKRSLAFMLTLALLLSLCPVLPFTADAAQYTDGAWYLNQDNPTKTSAWINIAFNTEAPLVDGVFVYEGDTPYDWTITAAPTKSTPATVAVKATITDAEGNIVGGEPVFLSAVAIAKTTEEKPSWTMFSAAEYTALTADLVGTFTLLCELQISGTTYASYTQKFSRVAAGEGGEGEGSGEGTPDQADPNTAYVKAELVEGVGTAAASNAVAGAVNFSNASFTDILYEVIDGEVYFKTTKWQSIGMKLDAAFLQGFDGKATVTIEYLEKGAVNADFLYHSTANSMSAHATKVVTDGSNSGELKTATYELTDAVLTNLAGKGISLALRVNSADANGILYIKSVTVTKPAAEGGEGEGEESAVNSAYAYVDYLESKVVPTNVAVGGYDIRNGKDDTGYNVTLSADPSKMAGAWNIVANTLPTFTLSPAFLEGFDGKAKVTLEFYDVSSGTAQFIYHSTDSTSKVHEVTYTSSGNSTWEVHTVSFDLTDAEFTNAMGKGWSFVINATPAPSGRIFLKSVRVEKPGAEEPGTTYSVDLTSASNVADLKFIDETPFDLALTATSDSASIELMDVTYTLNGGNLAQPVTETVKVPLNKDGKTILDAAWFTEKALGYGDFTLEVTMTKPGENEGQATEVAKKTFNFSRKMSSILVSDIVTAAEEKNGILVFSDDAALDLQLMLKNRLAEAFNGTVTYTFSKDGTALEGFDGKTAAVTDLTGEGQTIALELPEAKEYGTYKLAISIANSEGTEVHTKEVTFARNKTIFWTGTVSSVNTNDELVFVDDAAYDIQLHVVKLDGITEDLHFAYSLLKNGEEVKNGEFTKNVSATNGADVDLTDILADVEGFGTFNMVLTATNTLGYTCECALIFSRIESVIVDLTSATNEDLVFTDDEAYDLKLNLLKQSGEDRTFTVNYTVTKGETEVESGSFENVTVTGEGAELDVAMTNVVGNGTFTVTVTLVEGEETVKTVQFTVIRKSSMTVSLAHPGAFMYNEKLTYIDLVPYDFSVSMKKPQGEAEDVTVNYIVTDAEGKEVVNASTTASVGSTDATAVALDMTDVEGYGDFNLAISVLDVNGNEVAATSLDYLRWDTITSQLTSESNSDLVFTGCDEDEKKDVFDMALVVRNAAGRQNLRVTLTITGPGLEQPLTKTVNIKNTASATAPLNSDGFFPQLATMYGAGTYTVRMTVVDEAGRQREDVSYNFYRVAKDGTIDSAVTSASSEQLVFVPGGEIDMMLQIAKNDGVNESGFVGKITVTDKDGNEVKAVESDNLALTPSFKTNLGELLDLSSVTTSGVYNINLTLTDNSGNVRHENTVPFTLVQLEGSVDSHITSANNPDMIFTEGEEFDLTLHLNKNDGIAESFKIVATVTDKDGNELKKLEGELESFTSVKVPLDLSNLPATGTFKVTVVLTDKAGNERLNTSAAFTRVKKLSVDARVGSPTNADMIFTDKDALDLLMLIKKTDGIDEKLHVKYTVYNSKDEVVAGQEADMNLVSTDRKLSLAEDLAGITAHGIYRVHVLVTDNSGIVRSESDTRFVRISGNDIKHQVSGSASGTKMQFTPGMKLDLCLFVQKTDGIPERLKTCYLQVTDPSGNVVYSMKGAINAPATGYFKFPLPLDGKCTQFGTYKVSYSFTDDAGNLRVSNTAYFKLISPSGELAVAVKSASNKPGMIFSKEEPFDLVLYIQKADGVEQTLPVRYTISDMNGLVLETKEGKLALPATGYRKVPIELPGLEAFDKYGVFNMKVEVAGVDGKLIFSENYSFSRVLVPEKQLDVMGVCTHLSKRGMTASQAQQYVDLARQAGISFWRDELPWNTVEPTKGTYYFPAVCDAAVDYTLSIGLEPLFVLDYGNNNYGSDVTTDEWLEGYLGYVEAMVTHFKGRIKYYEVWNEWNIGLGGLDKKYRDYPELYARILIPTYKLIKEIDPTITVIGGVVAGGEEEWTEALLKCEGAIDAMDVFSYHEYPDNDVSEFVEQAEKVRALLTKYGRPDLPMWVSETGFPTHVGRNSFTEEVSAGNLVSMYTWAMANPDVLDQIFWYDLHNDGVERENGEHNFGLLRNWDLDKNPVPMAAKPSYVALCAMNSILVDAEYVGMYDMGHKEITAYHFKKDGKDLLVAWADDKALNMVATVGENNIIVTDMYGNASALDPVDGKVSLFFSDAPIYIEYDLSQKLDMVEGGFTLDKDLYTATPAAVFPVKITRDNGLEGQSGSYAFSMPETWSVEGIEFGAAEAGATEIIDTVYVTVGDDAAKGEMTITARAIIGGNVVGQFNVPIEMGDICTVNPDVVFTENGPEFKVSVQILNENSTKPLSGTINLLAPEELLGEASSIPFEIPAGENKAVLIDVPAEYANTYHTVKVEVVLGSGAKHEVTKPMSFLYAIEAPENMKLDGVIDEQWDDAMEFTIGEEDWFNDVSYDTEWTGNTAKGYAMWDKDYLYVAVEVHDASHYQVGSGASLWMGDSIQMTTDVSRFTVPAYYGYNEIGYSLNSENGAIENWNWFASPGKNVSAGGIFKIVRDDATETTTYEVALPWSELLPKEVEFDFRSLGFALIVNENSLDEDGDPTGRTGWIEYMSGIGYRKEPEKFGDLILVKRSEIQ